LTVLRFERYPVDAKRTEGFEALVGAFLDAMRAAPGLLWADATKAFDDDPSYVVLSEWRTDADLDAWESSGAATTFGDGVDVHLRDDPTSRRFTSD
jgi:heme-degrading monooxygenase HmoA